MSRTKYTVTIAFILVLLSAGAWYFLFDSIKQKNNSISQLENDIVFASERSEELASLNSFFTTNADNIALLKTYFVTKSEIDHFITQVEDVGTKSGVKVTINSVVPEDPTPDKTGSLSFKLNAQGSFKNVLLYASVLESLPYLVNFSQASFQTGGGGDIKDFAEPQWLASFDFKVGVIE